jgi:AcrR family transcriptional regulator
MVLRTKPEKKEEKEKTRAELMRAALRLAASFGFASLSLREVSREAAIAPTSFYRHFGDMEELGLAILDEAVQPALLDVIEACRKASSLKRDPFVSLVEALIAAVGDDPNLFRFLFAERVGGSKPFRSAAARCVRRLTDDLEQIIEDHGTGSHPASRSSSAEAAVIITLELGFQGLDATHEQRLALLARARKQMKLVAAGAASTTRRPGESDS